MPMHNELTALSLRQPWADALAHGHLPYLARTQRITRFGTILVLATKGVDRLAGIDARAYATSAIVGAVDLVDCEYHDDLAAALTEHSTVPGATPYPNHFVPAGNRGFVWRFERPAYFDKPIPFHERPGITWTKLDSAKYAAAVRAGLSAAGR